MQTSNLKLTSKATLFCALLFIASSLISFAQSDIWIQKNDLGYDATNVPQPSPRWEAIGFTIGSKGYLGTGSSISGFLKDFWEYDPDANTWTQKADFGGAARSSAVGFSISDKGYLGTGYSYDYDGTFHQYKDFWEYDPALNNWKKKVDFGGTARSSAVGFSIGDKGYLGTGNSGTVKVKDFWEYDPALNDWMQKADFGGTARYEAAGFSIGGKGYLGTGSATDGDKKDFWEYDPALNTWTKKADFGGTVRLFAVGFSISSKGYLGTGLDNTGNKKDLWEYNPVANGWTQKSDFGGTICYGAVGFGIGSKGYLGTGYSSSGYTKDFWEYDPALNTWTQEADFGGTARGSAVGFSIGSKGYLGTGSDGIPRKDFWEYDPAANVWTQKADFGGTARGYAVGFSIGNKGYLGTGYDINNSYKKDFWEYDPALNTWTQKANFGGTARIGAVGFSIGSKGYLGTGDATDGYKKDFWEYDPALNTWAQKVDLGGTARELAVGFSIDSKGYLGTGFNNGNYYKDFWEYDPAANIWTQRADFGGTALASAVGFSIGSKGYLGTGFSYSSANHYYNDFWEYDLDANTWTQKTDFGGTARYRAVGFSIGNIGYVGTGYDSSSSKKDFWEYTPEATANTCYFNSTFSIVNISSTSAQLKWLNITEALSYKVRYKPSGTTEWTITKSLDNNKTLHALTPSTEYTWQVKSFCDIKPIVASDWSEKQFFTTDPLRLSGQGAYEPMFSIYPNPVSLSALVSFSLNKASPVIIEIMDVNGRSLKVITHENFSSGIHEVTFNRESAAAGIYFLQMKTNEGLMMKTVVME